MKKGKEPLRTFGDLMQFYQHKTAATTEAKPTVVSEPSTTQTEAHQKPPIISEPVVNEPVASEPVVSERTPLEALPAETSDMGSVSSAADDVSPAVPTEESEPKSE